MSRSAPLAGLGVLVTRPAAQARTQIELIAAAGARALALPLLSIEPPEHPAAASAALEQPADVFVFTSVNAVEVAARLVPPPWPDAPYAVTGAATGAALRALGIGRILEPSVDGAAGVLALARLRELQGRRVCVVCGQSPLPDLVRGLRARGAEVTVAEVYRRLPVPHPPQRVRTALAEAGAAIVTSGEALDQLVRLTPGDLRHRLLALQLAVPSPRISERARAAGFVHPALLPPRMGDRLLVQALVSWWRDRVETRNR